MLSDHKFFRALWFARICLLFGTLGCLFAGYLRTFVNPDIMESYVFITTALINGMLFFSTFPGYRIDIRFNQIKKKFFERTDFDNNLPAGASTKNDVRCFIRHLIIITILTFFIIINFLLAQIAYSNSKFPIMFLHMVVIIIASFIFNAFLLMYRVDETFKKLERLISKLSKGQIT